MNFEKHAFISYAHIDNAPINKSEEGWISNFHDSLDALVSMKLGENVRIWRDNKLKGSDIFSEEIVEQFPNTALLISVITPRYIKSEWCTKEIKEFYDSASKNIGIRIGNKSRILKVLKTPVEQSKIPPEMKESLGYEFYKLDENGRPKEFNKVFGEDAKQAYLNRVDDLACDIQEILNLMDESLVEDASKSIDKPTVAPTKKINAVYVAQTSYDLSSERDLIIRELKDHGYQVFPDKHLSIVEEEFTKEVVQYLEQCQLTVHLVGKSYGAIPDGPTQKSASILQNEIAAVKSKLTNLPRIVWMPQGIQYDDERQQQFVNKLNENEEAQFGADLIEGSIEDLKAVLHDKIKQLEKPVGKKERNALTTEKKIYLICDSRDRELTLPLRKYLISMNFEVAIPLFEGDPTKIRLEQEENLSNCDAVIIFYGKGDESWKRSKTNDLKKINAYKRNKPLLAKYLYLADPSTVDKEEHIELGIPNVINGLKGFSTSILDDFMNKIEQAD